MRNATIFDQERLIKYLCFVVLAFIPINMLVSPLFDFFAVVDRGTNWTVTMSAFVFFLVCIPFFTLALLQLKSRAERIFLLCATAFFIYAFVLTIFMASSLFYPIYGLISLLGSTLVGTLFYVAVRDKIINHTVVFHALAFASVFIAIPMVLVQIDPARFAQLAEGMSAAGILYGYENPRAVGWACTIFLSLLTAHLSTQPTGSKFQPVFLLLIIVCSTTLFWSGSRGGVFAFAISFPIVILLSQTRNYTGILSSLFCIAAGAAVSLFLYLPSLSFGIFSRVSQNLGQESIADVSSGRTELWTTTISYIVERPLTGYGYLPHKNLPGFNHGSAHNIVLDAWLWFGLLIGTVLILLALLLWAKTLGVFRKANDPYISGLFCVITTLLLYSLVSGPYARTFPLLLFAIPCGVILGLRSARAK